MIETLKQDMWRKCRLSGLGLNTKGFSSLPVLTLREIHMVEFMEYLTDIPEWWKKVSYPPYNSDHSTDLVSGL